MQLSLDTLLILALETGDVQAGELAHALFARGGSAYWHRWFPRVPGSTLGGYRYRHASCGVVA